MLLEELLQRRKRKEGKGRMTGSHERLWGKVPLVNECLGTESPWALFIVVVFFKDRLPRPLPKVLVFVCRSYNSPEEIVKFGETISTPSYYRTVCGNGGTSHKRL